MRIVSLTLGAVLAAGGSLAAWAAWVMVMPCLHPATAPYCPPMSPAPCSTPSASGFCDPFGAIFWTYVAVTGAILVVLGAVLKSRGEATDEALAGLSSSSR